ncbi:MAG: aspartyl/asparaginyl beta-hydroxylase domain-containing protein [Vicinamibacterales bacterium]
MATDTARTVTRQYSALIEALMAFGDDAQARECATLAVRHGVWKDPLQRPSHFDPTLPQQPLYDPARFWFVPYLEGHAAAIRDEVRRVTEEGYDRLSSAGSHEPLVGSGRWSAAVFYERGVRKDDLCATFPKTAEIVSRIPDAMQSGGVVMLSWLAPGTHLVPHCGTTNTRLRVHLGIRVPEGASMRVGDRTVSWREGTCVVFDDSFEHEVWNPTAEPRVVLLFDILHPDLPEERRLAARQHESAAVDSMVRNFMAARGIAGIARDPASGALTVVPDEPTTRIIAHYMKDHNATRVRVANGALVID